MTKILLVEDDDNLRVTVDEWLTFEEFTVESAANGLDGYELFLKSPFDLIILDCEMPGLDGIDLCQRIRARKAEVPVIFLTGKSDLADKELGFGAGANDYLTKPFHMKELSLRVKALLRKPAVVEPSVLKVGRLVLNPATHQATCDGAALHLTKIEFGLLEELMRNPGKLYTSASLLEKFWVNAAERSPESLRTCLKKLREKIDVEGQPSLIKNIHGVGYKLEASD